MKKFIFLVLVFLLTNLSPYTFAEEKRPYLCFPFSKAPVLDGKLTGDSAWKDMPMATDFIDMRSKALASKQTSFKIGYTREALYIGIECEEPQVEKIKTKLEDMESLWKEDSIEVFIFPKGADNYYQFVVNTIGARWNGIRGKRSEKIGPQPLWDWQAKTYQGKDYYSVEIKIPFETFHVIPEKGEEWTGNICRNIFTTSGDKFTCWAYVVKGFHDPDRFERIIFAGDGPKEKIIINFLKKKINANLVLISALENDFSKAQKRHLSLQKEIVSFWKNYKEIKEKVPQLNSAKETNLLLKRSKDLLKEAEELKRNILLENLFGE